MSAALCIDMDDNDLKGRFDNIDVRFDTVDARFDKIDTRFAEVDARFAAIDVRFDGVDARFDEVDGRFTEVAARFTEVAARFTEVAARFTEVDARFNEMRQLILEEGRRTRTHFDVVAEGLKDQIKVIGEGHAALVAHNTATDNRLQRLEDGEERMEARMLSVESRVDPVEKTQRQPRRRT